MSDAAALTDLERRAAFLLRLRAVGVRDLQVLRAMEAVPRTAFFPGVDPEIAARDVALPLPCGESAERPSAIALGLEALGLQPGQRVVEVGTGSGYVTALLVRMGARVHSMDRRRSLVEAARRRLAALGLDPDALDCADALAVSLPPRSVARVVLHVALPEPPPVMVEGLEPDGRLLYSTGGHPRRLMLVRPGPDGAAETVLGPSTAMPALAGLAP